MVNKKEYSKKYYIKNKEKYKQYQEKNSLKIKQYKRKYKIKCKYGLKILDYELMFKKQNGLCAICCKNNNKKLLSVDHCHDTLIIRGLLCTKCNIGLGYFNDDVNLLNKAVLYLNNTP